MATFALFDDAVMYIFYPTQTSPHTLSGAPVNFGATTPDDFRVALSNTTINSTTQASASFLNDLTEIAGGAGYTPVTTVPAGASAATPTLTETSGGSGVWQFTTEDIQFQSSGSFAQFRYPILCDVSCHDGSNNPLLIGFLDYGSAVDLTSGNTFTVNVGINGWFQITVPNFA